jgi:hypothetical protein
MRIRLWYGSKFSSMTHPKEEYSGASMPPDEHHFTDEELRGLVELAEVLKAIDRRLPAEGKSIGLL